MNIWYFPKYMIIHLLLNIMELSNSLVIIALNVLAASYGGGKLRITTHPIMIYFTYFSYEQSEGAG